jgi:hypothetical protein
MSIMGQYSEGKEVEVRFPVEGHFTLLHSFKTKGMTDAAFYSMGTVHCFTCGKAAGMRS